jgi:hypothetical protein
METDLRLAGFWGYNEYASNIELNGNTADCGLTPFLDPGVAIQAWDDDNNNFPCARNNPRLDSDVFVVRHASQQGWSVPDGEWVPDPGRLQLISNRNAADVFGDGVLPAGYGIDPDFPDFEPTVRNVVVNAYYVSDFTEFYPGLPSLRRVSLDANGNWEDQEVIPGVENMQVQRGIDTDGDNVVDRYVDPEFPATAGNKVISLRLWLLVRSEIAETGYSDSRVYNTPDATVPTLVAGGAYPENYRRIAVTKTVLLNNELNANAE